MKRIKKFVLASLFLSLPMGAWAQVWYQGTVGVVMPFASSNLFTSSLGIGLNLGYCDHFAISNRLHLAYELDAYYGGMTLNYKAGDSVSLTPTGSATCIALGGNLKLGLNYYIIPKQLSVGAGIFGGYNVSLFLSDNEQYIIGYQSAGYNNPIFISDVANSMNNYNYGVCFSTELSLGKHALSLKLDLGLNNFTSGMELYNSKTNKSVACNTNLSIITLNYHYYIYKYSLAKNYQNKLLK